MEFFEAIRGIGEKLFKSIKTLMGMDQQEEGVAKSEEVVDHVPVQSAIEDDGGAVVVAFQFSVE